MNQVYIPVVALNFSIYLRRRRSWWRRISAVVGRENAQQKFSAHAGVGRVARRPFQIGGVLNRQNVFVKRRGIGVPGRGAVFCSADGLFSDLFAGPKVSRAV